MNELFLACIAFAVQSGSWTQNLPAVNSGLSVWTEESRKLPASQSCRVYRSLDDAVLAHYKRGELDESLHIFTINTSNLSIKPVKTPRVTVQVEKN